MPISYNADEIFEISVNIEKNGKKFYENAKNISQDKIIKQFFESLANWEEQHIKLFSNLKSSLPASAREPVSFDPSNENLLYLKAAADSHIFRADADINAIIKRCKTFIDALSMALTFEKDSVVFYSTMLNLIPEHLGRKEVEKILNEELKHVAIITAEMEKLKK
jgi:rubrerythrin